ncbi:hypothetical protein [Massilia sp. CCM 8734]|uniref:hypothetical protein n=1 Tax=Massilia sp. CCM 8734 TaxID=2609283 RepID=UPI00141F1B10|nr:hypothetical protein [Massilia sp. CCM 8734]NIA00500.1 hypothetical protein [Massilia sp. CCM 8734]
MPFMKNPLLTAVVCFLLAGALFFAMSSKEYAAGFALAGMFFALTAGKKILMRNRKNPPSSDAPD